MTGRAVATVVAGTAAAVLACCGLATVAGTGGAGGVGCLPGPSVSVAAPPTAGPYRRIGVWSSTQVRNAALIIAVGQHAGVPPRGWVIAVATAMQESSLRNRPDGPDGSIGLFQQRPSAGWGTPEQIRDPEYAAKTFYAHLVNISGWQRMPLADAAQQVQHSGDGRKYAKREKPALDLVAALTGVSDLGGCVPGSVGPQGWTQPVGGRITSEYGPRNGGFHAGVDLRAPKGTSVHAASAGTVTAVVCDAERHNDGSPYSCDVDGSMAIDGCGWYVDITHAGGILTRYCHMLTHPHVTVGQKVSAGQVIGLSGNSGNSSGPHLHYQIEVHGRTVNPVLFMAAHSAALGQPG